MISKEISTMLCLRTPFTHLHIWKPMTVSFKPSRQLSVPLEHYIAFHSELKIVSPSMMMGMCGISSTIDYLNRLWYDIAEKYVSALAVFTQHLRSVNSKHVTSCKHKITYLIENGKRFSDYICSAIRHKCWWSNVTTKNNVACIINEWPDPKKVCNVSLT